jgi:hypothetical protein
MSINDLQNSNVYIKIIEVLNKTKWWLILLLFFVFLIQTFKSEIKHFIDFKVMNKDVVFNRLEGDVMVQDALYELMHDTNSDRAYIFRFHNGVTYYDGSHKAKMSCDFEVTREGISEEAQRLQDLPVGLYANWILNVVNNRMIYDDINKIQDSRVRILLKKQGIKSIAVLPYYRDGKIVALIGVDYVTQLNTIPVSINQLKVKVNQIGNLLN